jgi:hypothetical protein
MQDVWRPEINVVVSRPYGADSPVYVIKPLVGGKEVTVNRKDLKPAASLVQPLPPDECEEAEDRKVTEEEEDVPGCSC